MKRDEKPRGIFDALGAFYTNHLILIWSVVVIAPWAILALLCATFPKEVYDGFVYRYLWAPIVADAVPGSGESTNYNVVNTTFYAIWVVITMLGLYEVRKRNVLEAIPVDERFVLALLPLVVLGGVLRALQDSALFGEPATYLFIAPLIYPMLCIFAAPMIIYSIWTSYPKERSGSLKRFSYGCIALFIIYILALLIAPDQMMLYPGWPVAIIIIVACAFLFHLLSQKYHVAYSAMFSYGLMLLLFFLSIAAFWGSVGRWTDSYLRFDPSGATPRPMELVIIPGITAGITALYVVSAYLIKKKYPSSSRILSIENTLLVFGQMIDATATWRGIDAYGYSEKNVIPIAVVGGAGSGIALFALKLLIVIPLIYLLDIALEKEMRGRESLRTIIKAGIMILGMGPGIRDTSRIAMGI